MKNRYDLHFLQKCGGTKGKSLTSMLDLKLILNCRAVSHIQYIRNASG